MLSINVFVPLALVFGFAAFDPTVSIIELTFSVPLTPHVGQSCMSRPHSEGCMVRVIRWLVAYDFFCFLFLGRGCQEKLLLCWCPCDKKLFFGGIIACVFVVAGHQIMCYGKKSVGKTLLLLLLAPLFFEFFFYLDEASFCFLNISHHCLHLGCHTINGGLICLMPTVNPRKNLF